LFNQSSIHHHTNIFIDTNIVPYTSTEPQTVLVLGCYYTTSIKDDCAHNGIIVKSDIFDHQTSKTCKTVTPKMKKGSYFLAKMADSSACNIKDFKTVAPVCKAENSHLVLDPSRCFQSKGDKDLFRSPLLYEIDKSKVKFGLVS
jgi:hypothetical protein